MAAGHNAIDLCYVDLFLGYNLCSHFQSLLVYIYISFSIIVSNYNVLKKIAKQEMVVGKKHKYSIIKM